MQVQTAKARIPNVITTWNLFLIGFLTQERANDRYRHEMIASTIAIKSYVFNAYTKSLTFTFTITRSLLRVRTSTIGLHTIPSIGAVPIVD